MDQQSAEERATRRLEAIMSAARAAGLLEPRPSGDSPIDLTNCIARTNTVDEAEPLGIFDELADIELDLLDTGAEPESDPAHEHEGSLHLEDPVESGLLAGF